MKKTALNADSAIPIHPFHQPLDGLVTWLQAIVKADKN